MISNNCFSNKANSLFELQSKGYNVPSFIVFNLNINYVSDESIYSNYEKIKNFFFSTTQIIIRPSIQFEDSAKSSFAGIMSSYVLKYEEMTFLKLKEIIKKTKANINSSRFNNYCKRMSIRTTDSVYCISFIVQEFINGSPAGVMFTSNPIDNDGSLLIESTKGHNATITSGVITPDIIFVNKSNGNIKSKIIGDKRTIIEFEDGVKRTRNNTDRFFSISNDKIECLYRIGLEIEKSFNCPQDIEWIFLNDRLFLLQSRPIIFT